MKYAHKKLILYFLLFFVFGYFNAFCQDVYVNGYYRANGTYVQPYYRTAPNNTNSDNYSTEGNINPYTGETGTIPSDGGVPEISEYTTYPDNHYDNLSERLEEHRILTTFIECEKNHFKNGVYSSYSGSNYFESSNVIDKDTLIYNDVAGENPDLSTKSKPLKDFYLDTLENNTSPITSVSNNDIDKHSNTSSNSPIGTILIVIVVFFVLRKVLK